MLQSFCSMPQHRGILSLALILSFSLSFLSPPADANPSTHADSIAALVGDESKLESAKTLVLFGATGDLAGRKLFPSLHKLHQQGMLGDSFRIVAASPRIGEDFKTSLRERVSTLAGVDVSTASWKKFETLIVPQTVSFDDQASVERLKKHLGKGRSGVFYLALPTAAFEPAVIALSKSNLVGNTGSAAKNTLVFEKPFGNNLKETRKLGDATKNIPEDRVMRMDHYLGKQSVLSLMSLRFIDKRLEGMWNRQYVSRVEISATEKLDIQGRGGFYDKTGAMRDFVQGHLMQVLSIVAMEAPGSASKLRDAKAESLKLVQPIDTSKVVRGQYQGYRQTEGVNPRSTTESYVALQAQLRGQRWQGVPFAIESGKALSEKRTQVKVHFKSLEPGVARELGVSPGQPAVLTIAIDPKAEITLRSGNKEITIQPTGPEIKEREPYERLLLAAVTGSQGLFAGRSEIEQSWKILDPVARSFRLNQVPLSDYKRSSKRPRGAKKLFTKARPIQMLTGKTGKTIPSKKRVRPVSKAAKRKISATKKPSPGRVRRLR